jgi:FAD/FMN-containing dehydrogenase
MTSSAAASAHTVLAESPGVRALADTLRRRVEGEVDFSTGARVLYATDASNYRQVPVGVVLPRTTEDVLEIVRTRHEHGVPILPRSAGTSLAGQGCNAALVMDMSRHLRRILDIDPERKPRGSSLGWSSTISSVRSSHMA